jgi:hypothetical protein
MPVSSDEWERGTSNWIDQERQGYTEEKLLEYLELNRDKGFTAEELAKIYARDIAGEGLPGGNPDGVNLADYSDDPGVFSHLLSAIGEVVFTRSGRIKGALQNLEKKGLIESKAIETTSGEQTYYRTK